MVLRVEVGFEAPRTSMWYPAWQVKALADGLLIKTGGLQLVDCLSESEYESEYRISNKTIREETNLGKDGLLSWRRPCRGVQGQTPRRRRHSPQEYTQHFPRRYPTPPPPPFLFSSTDRCPFSGR